eukprot:8531-Eustigmatos_ZCMA.PRE.1
MRGSEAHASKQARLEQEQQVQCSMSNNQAAHSDDITLVGLPRVWFWSLHARAHHRSRINL